MVVQKEIGMIREKSLIMREEINVHQLPAILTGEKQKINTNINERFT